MINPKLPQLRLRVFGPRILSSLFIAQNKEHMGEISFPTGAVSSVQLRGRSSEAKGHS